MVDALQASLKAAAVGGLFMAWAKITIEAFKLSWRIITLQDETWEPVVKQMDMCKKCGSPYFLDEVDHLCGACSDDLLEK